MLEITLQPFLYLCASDNPEFEKSLKSRSIRQITAQKEKKSPGQ